MVTPNVSKPNKASIKYYLKRFFNFKAWNSKLLMTRLSALLLVLIVVALVLNITNKTQETQTKVVKKVDPCAFFTAKEAKAVLGAAVVKGGVAPINYSSTKYLQATTCVYTQDSQKNQVVVKNAAVTIMSPKNTTGTAYNQNTFGADKASGVQDISGYGQKAYWDPQLGVLNILKGDKRVVVSVGSPSSVSDRTLNDTKKFADIILSKI
jgi:hypothetical protein